MITQLCQFTQDFGGWPPGSECKTSKAVQYQRKDVSGNSKERMMQTREHDNDGEDNDTFKNHA